MEDRDVNVGGQVILGRHTRLEPDGRDDPNWHNDMNQYVGVQTQVRDLRPLDVVIGGEGSRVARVLCARVEIDNGASWWHVRDMSPPRLIEDTPPPERNPKFQIGDLVVLGEHTPIPNVTNDLGWRQIMLAYVGKTATVTDLFRAGIHRSPDLDPWLMHVDLDGGNYAWRMRDSVLASKALYVTDAMGMRFLATPKIKDITNPRGFTKNDVVRLFKHVPRDASHQINHQLQTHSYWNAEMAEFVGKNASIQEVHQGAEKGRTTVTVDIDGGKHRWRCLDLVMVSRASGPYPYFVGDTVVVLEDRGMPDSSYTGRLTRIHKIHNSPLCYNLEVDHGNSAWEPRFVTPVQLYVPKPSAPPLSWTAHVRGYA